VSWTSLGAVALLRGINVGGRARIPMADLRAVATDLDLAAPRTHLQSGNLVFTTSPDDLSGVGERLESAIVEAFGVDVRVLIRTHDDLAAAVARNPFSVAAASDPKGVHLLFLDRAPTPEAISGLDPDRSPPDEFQVSGREIFLRYPNGSGRSKLTLDWFERRLGAVGTARNWRTVAALLELTAPGGQPG
jgi:uncharacterized protein (DUF1697 family)